MLKSQTRIRRPAVRAGYLQHGPASREGRGKEPFVEVSWAVTFVSILFGAVFGLIIAGVLSRAPKPFDTPLSE